METRLLGSTGRSVSVIGMGCAMLGNTSLAHGVALVQRALERGATYFDTARLYADSEVKLGLALGEARRRVFLSTKTASRTADAAWRDVNQSLERLRTDVLDNVHLHALESPADVDRRLAEDGAIQALVRARDQGLTRFIGCTGHRPDVLLYALERFPFDIILVPMNLVERHALDALIPHCRSHGVGVTIMKPLATGLLPAKLALRWLRTQAVDVAVPGMSTLAEVDEDLSAGEGPAFLSQDEAEMVEELRQQWDHRRCRMCGECLPCPVGIPIDMHLGTDMIFDHLRTMGSEGFRRFPWGRETIAADAAYRRDRIPALEACTRCGACTQRCPYGLPVMDMVLAMLPGMREILDFEEQWLGRHPALQPT